MYLRHSREMRKVEIAAFLVYPAVTQNVSTDTEPS
jgi:hypothetical protein